MQNFTLTERNVDIMCNTANFSNQHTLLYTYNNMNSAKAAHE